MTGPNVTTQVWTTAHLAALASPTETLSFVPQPLAFSAQTVRQAVRLRRGGSQVRIVLSNQFGRVPLTIDQVVLGHADASNVVPALCQDSARWEIRPGATATSDPVALSTQAGDELVITCFISGHAAPAAFLHSAQRTGRVAPGNQVHEVRLVNTEAFTSLYWIERVLVDEPASGPVIVCLGDSITRGDGTSVDRDQRYPDHLQRRLLEAGNDRAAVLNAGIGANRLLRPGVGPSMTDRFARDVLGVAEATHVLIMGGVNDIVLPFLFGEQRPTADEIIGGLFAIARQAQQHGIQPMLGTITPFLGSRYESFRAHGNEDIRRAVNHALRTQEDWPVVNFAAALAAPEDPTQLALAFDSGDGVHPGDDGSQALANAIELTTFNRKPDLSP